MIPATSDIYKYTEKLTDATEPRIKGSVVLNKWSSNPKDYRLEVAYRAYKRTSTPKSGPKVNLVFHHGVGMNKGIWHKQIDEWFSLIPNLNYAVAVDSVNHGQSAVANKDKLGHKLSWIDFAKDVIKVVKVDEADEFLQPGVVNILIGHSFGGMVSLTAAYIEPTLFDAIAILNPVAHGDDESNRILQKGYYLWHQKGYIQNVYEIADDQKPEDAIYLFYRKKSFFKRFDDTILRNMIEDETIEDTFNDGKAHTSTEPDQEFVTYLGGPDSLSKAYITFSKIGTPVYHIVGDKDPATDEAIGGPRKSLQSVLHPIDIPGGTHLLNAEKPEIFVDVIKKIVDERIEIAKEEGDNRYPEHTYLKTHGSNYKQDLLKNSLDEGFGKPKL